MGSNLAYWHNSVAFNLWKTMKEQNAFLSDICLVDFASPISRSELKKLGKCMKNAYL